MSNETTTPTPELAPCPACGGKANISGVPAWYKASCSRITQCGLIGPMAVSPISATDAWNALAADVAMGKLAPKLAEAIRLTQKIEDWGLHLTADVEDSMSALWSALAEFDALTATTKEATR